MSPSTNPVRNYLRSATWVHLALIVAFALSTVVVAGCGSGEKAKDDVVLAKVGDKEILGSYYENRLVLLKHEELPKDDQGKIMDLATQAGKEKFLETLINKEVMSKTAVAMGYEKDQQIASAKKSLLAYQAQLAMANQEINAPANSISEEQLQDFYSKMGQVRKCRYVVTNFRPEAQAAFEMAKSGADWDDVVAKYQGAAEDPTGMYEFSVPFGRYYSSFGDAVFATAVGEVTEPVETANGFWVLKIESEEQVKRPPLEDAKARILDAVRRRAIAAQQADLGDRIHAKYHLVMHDDALLKCYEGLPVDEALFYPGTKDAIKREDLKPLEIATVDRELPFYGFTKPDGTEVLYSLGDYKTHFDKMSSFQRPKRTQMVGGLRQSITAELDKTLMPYEARAMGFFDDEGVLLKVNARIEQMLVNKLYNDAVTFDKQVTAEDLAAFWADHESDYYMPETRSGRLVICSSAETASHAVAAIGKGLVWRDVLVKFGTDKNNKSRSGKLGKIRQDTPGVLAEALFSLTKGQISQPIPMENGRFGVVKLGSIVAPHQIELLDVAEEVGTRMKKIREEDAFQAMLGQWKSKLNIVTLPENLSGLKSWRELTAPPAPEDLVPRNQ